MYKSLGFAVSQYVCSLILSYGYGFYTRAVYFGEICWIVYCETYYNRYKSIAIGYSYIKKIEWLLSCNDSNLSEQTVALLTERNDAIKNYRNKILCAEQLTAHQEEIISSVIHMFCNRLTGDRSLEQKYLNIMREGLSNIIEKGKRNPINEH